MQLQLLWESISDRSITKPEVQSRKCNAVSLANSDESLFMISVKFINFAEIRSRSKKKYTNGTETENEMIPESY